MEYLILNYNTETHTQISKLFSGTAQKAYIILIFLKVYSLLKKLDKFYKKMHVFNYLNTLIKIIYLSI